MKKFIQVTRTDEVDVTINVDAIQAIIRNSDETSFIHFLAGGLDGLIVKDKYEDLLHILSPDSKTTERKPQKVAKGVIIR